MIPLIYRWVNSQSLICRRLLQTLKMRFIILKSAGFIPGIALVFGVLFCRVVCWCLLSSLFGGDCYGLGNFLLCFFGFAFRLILKMRAFLSLICYFGLAGSCVFKYFVFYQGQQCYMIRLASPLFL